MQAGGGAVVGHGLGHGSGIGRGTDLGGRRRWWVAGDGCKARAMGGGKEGDGLLCDVFKTLWVLLQKKQIHCPMDTFSRTEGVLVKSELWV